LSVRLPEAEKRRIKIMAASQGVTIRQAIHEAFDAWAFARHNPQLIAHLRVRGCIRARLQSCRTRRRKGRGFSPCTRKTSSNRG